MLIVVEGISTTILFKEKRGWHILPLVFVVFALTYIYSGAKAWLVSILLRIVTVSIAYHSGVVTRGRQRCSAFKFGSEPLERSSPSRGLRYRNMQHFLRQLAVMEEAFTRSILAKRESEFRPSYLKYSREAPRHRQFDCLLNHRQFPLNGTAPEYTYLPTPGIMHARCLAETCDLLLAMPFHIKCEFLRGCKKFASRNLSALSK